MSSSFPKRGRLWWVLALSPTLATLLRQLAAACAELHQERCEKDRLSGELGLHDAVLDAASSHFMIVDVISAAGRILYVTVPARMPTALNLLN